MAASLFSILEKAKPENNEETQEDLPPNGEDEEYAREKEEMKILKKWLYENLDLFVITQVLLGVQFFKNYEDEIAELRKECKSGHGQDLEGHRMRLYKADKLMERVGTHVVYRPRHGPLKNTESLLHPLRSYLVYGNVEIQRADDLHLGNSGSPQELPFYKLQSEELEGDENRHLRDAGYVNLKEIESSPEEGIYESVYELDQTAMRSDSISSSEPDNFLINLMANTRRNSLNTRRNSLNTRRNSLKVESDENIYGYKTIQNLTAPKSIHQVRLGTRPTSSCVIPQELFKTILVPNLSQMGRRIGVQGKSTIKVNYLSSVNFLRHFLDVIAVKLAEPLHLTREIDYSPVQVQGGRVSVTQGIATHHIIPVLSADFFPEAAEMYFERKFPRTTVVWPRPFMNRHIERMGSYLQPLGYLKRRGNNPNFDIQWRYTCPWAEEYLLLHTMHAHVRVYLFTMTIFKTFFNAENSCLSINNLHILHLLFWQVQEDFTGWPEDKPGITLLHFLTTLHKAIENRRIFDFFIENRNLLESSPFMYINKAQGILFRLLENPLPYILLSIKNLRMRSHFYPELDISRIYKLVTTKNLIAYLYPHTVPRKRTTSEDSEDEFEGLDLDMAERERRWKIKYHKELKEEKQAKLQKELGSTETINIDTFERVHDSDTIASERRQALLHLFIRHFVEMARKSIEFRTFNQAKMYLLQCKRLNVLLKEEGVDSSEISRIENQIAKEQSKCETLEATFTGNDEVKREGDTDDVGVRLSVHSRSLPQVPTT